MPGTGIYKNAGRVLNVNGETPQAWLVDANKKDEPTKGPQYTYHIKSFFLVGSPLKLAKTKRVAFFSPGGVKVLL